MLRCGRKCTMHKQVLYRMIKKEVHLHSANFGNTLRGGALLFDHLVLLILLINLI